MTDDWAREIKETLNARQVLTRYGVRVNAGGFARCPFHSGGAERTPSLKCYDGRGGYHCFGCGETGSVLDFVMKYFNLSFKDACKKLNDDFGIGLRIGEELNEEERKRISREAYERRKRRREYENRRKMAYTAYYAALDRYTELDAIISKSRSESDKMEISGDLAYALNHIDAAKYNLDEAEANLRRFEAEERAM